MPKAEAKPVKVRREKPLGLSLLDWGTIAMRLRSFRDTDILKKVGENGELAYHLGTMPHSRTSLK